MALKLTLTGGGDSLAGPGGAQQQQRQTKLLSSGTLSLGRGPGNDWVLPDPDRHLSKTHCVVSVERGQYILTDLSTNGVYVNGARQPTARDDRIVLTDGDDFRLGDYVVRVEEVDAAGAAAQPYGGGAAHPAGAFGGADPVAAFGDPFGDPIAGRGRDEGRSPLDIDPLDDPLGRPPDPAFRHPVTRHNADQHRAPDPFDLRDEQKHRVADPDDDLFRGTPASPLWQGPAQPDHADAPAHAFSAPKVISPRPPPPSPGAAAPSPVPGGVGLPPPPGEIDFDALIGDLSPILPGGPSPASGGSPAPQPQARQQPIYAPPAPQPAPPAAAAAPQPPHAAGAAPPPAAAGYQPGADPFGSLDDLLQPPAPVAAPPAVAADGGLPPPEAARPMPAAAAAMPTAAAAMPAALASAADVAAPVVSTPPRPAPAATVPAASPLPSPSMPPPPPPEAARPTPAAITASDAGGSAGGQAAAVAALAAFLAGAGVEQHRLPAAVAGDPEAALRAAGQVFRAMAEGLREVLMSRAAIKGEMRVEQTMIRARDNNALKFSVTAEDAVASLLGGDRAGYMPPLAAAREAFADIKSHELAVMAGVQDALVALLRRFDPESLEKRLASGLLDAVLPAARKARLWEGFRQTYGEIAREAEDDFQAVFGREFARAYAAQAVRKE